MALAEPRRRQKWTLNPRGNLWANDTDKLGQKLMEKMGWEQGKGLGAKQDGMLKPITMLHKDDSKGIGFQGHDDTWLAHQDDFQAVLAALNAEHGSKETEGEKKRTSLEESSKNSKKRIHYQKFTRGKDLSNYSADDLGCILGTKSIKLKKKKEKDATEEEEVTSAVGTEEKSHGLVIIQGGNYQDYFAKKMKELKAKGKTTYSPSDPVVSKEGSEYSDEVERIEFYTAETEPTELIPTETSLEEKKKKSKKKEKEKSETFETDEPTKENSVLENEEPFKKKKKAKKSEETSEIVERIEAPDTVEESLPKRKKERTEEASNPQEEEKASKKKKEKTVEDPELQSIGEAVTPEKMKKKKNKKGKKEKNEQESPNAVTENDSGCDQEGEIKQKKKKKGKKEKMEKVEEPDRKRKNSENSEEMPKKKKKKSRDETPVQEAVKVKGEVEKGARDRSLGFSGSNVLFIKGYGV